MLHLLLYDLLCFHSGRGATPMPKEESDGKSGQRRTPRQVSFPSTWRIVMIHTIFSLICYPSTTFILTLLSPRNGSRTPLMRSMRAGMARAVCAKGSFPKRGHLRGKDNTQGTIELQTAEISVCSFKNINDPSLKLFPSPIF